MRKFICFLVIIAGLSTDAFAQKTIVYPTIGEIHREATFFDKIIPPDAKIEVLASGFQWSEGPVWIKEGAYLVFSDVPQNTIFKWKEGEGISTFMKPSGYTGIAAYSNEPGSNGLTLHPNGQLVMCEHGDRRISILDWNGGKRTLTDNFEGRRFNSPNDAVYNKDGDLYFTDPPYGLPKQQNDPGREMDYAGVFRLSKNGKTTLLTNEMTFPNGIAFSPDEKTLYVAQSDAKAAIWKAFPVLKDGSLGKGKIFYDATASVGKKKGMPDGMKLDKDGNIFATGPGGIIVFSPDGKVLGTISPGENPSNVAWGDDGSVLYFTVDMYLCRIKTSTLGDGW